ncbi:MAG: hypothetical protein A4E47_00322 [Methanosaeta sp. PtaU1.Bin028]|nr:MAG: hypothetical protein A4E47_00322 [Methanosaeta sp. PtaU1.Bin028]
MIASGITSGIPVKLNVELDNLGIDKKLNFKFYYPHYKMEIPGVGTIYLDHGHFNVKEQRLMKSILAKIYKYGAKYFSNSRIFESEFKSADPEEIYSDLEANFSAVFCLLYHSKMDDMVRGGRDFIWRLKKKTWLGFSMLLSTAMAAVTSLFTFILPGMQAEKPVELQSVLGYSNLVPWGVLTALIYAFPRLSSLLLSRIVANTVSGERGTPVDKVLPNITKKDISIEKKNYKYINLMQDLGNEGKKIDYYIFGHTHMAGWKKDPESDLTIYNCGGWVKDPNKKTCTSSFIIIDPNEKQPDQIKIYRMEREGKVPCTFDKRGRCDMNCGK